MKRIITRLLAVCLAALLLLSAVACKSEDTEKNPTVTPTATEAPTATETPAKNLTAAEIEAKIHAALGDEAYVCTVPLDEETFSLYYGMDMTKVEDWIATEGTITAIQMDMVVALKVADDYIDTAVGILNELYANKVSYTRLYPFESEKVLNARLYVQGNYVVYVLAGASYEGEDDVAQAQLAVDEYAKIDAAMAELFGSVPENKIVVPEDTGDEGGEGDDGNIGGGLMPPLVGGLGCAFH